MKRIKDFFYSVNDILIILLILAGAAALIYWRIGIIMDYPKTLAVEIQEGTAEGLDIEMPEVTEEEPEEPKNETITNNTTPPEPGEGPRDSTIWKDGKLKVSVTIETQEGSAAEAAEALIQAGLFTSYEDYEAVCNKAGVSADDIKATEFTFPVGTTQEDIVIEVTKEME